MSNVDYINPRYEGYFYSDSFPDQVCKSFYELLPPSSQETLPAYWAYKSHEKFLEKYGHLGTVVWAHRSAYTALLISGVHVMRIDTTSTYPRVELNGAVFNALTNTTIKGLKPKPSEHFKGRVSIRDLSEVPIVVQAIKTVYNL